jgi:hypothetical protein
MRSHFNVQIAIHARMFTSESKNKSAPDNSKAVIDDRPSPAMRRRSRISSKADIQRISFPTFSSVHSSGRLHSTLGQMDPAECERSFARLEKGLRSWKDTISCSLVPNRSQGHQRYEAERPAWHAHRIVLCFLTGDEEPAIQKIIFAALAI